MKVLNLHIENIRGIRNIDLKLDGENFVVYGPNGTGKSAVVDALDFLFTGDILRLRREGTLGISPYKYGRHIDAGPKETIVKAVIKINDSPDTFEIQRSLHEPRNLKILRGEKEKLSDVLEIAKRGHHVLSRREILRYVAAPKGERAREIQTLLNLNYIEKLRKYFVTIENEMERDFQSARSRLNSIQNDICAYLSVDRSDFSVGLALEKVNNFRRILKSKSIEKFVSEEIKKDLEPPSFAGTSKVVDPIYIINHVINIQKIMANSSKLKENEKTLVSQLDGLRGNESLNKEYRSLKLLEYGISMIDDSGKCPLCEKDWDPKELREKLELRLISAKEGRDLKNKITELSGEISSVYNDLRDRIEKIKKNFNIFSLDQYDPVFKGWMVKIEEYLSKLEESEDNYKKIKKVSEEDVLISLDNQDEIFKDIKTKVEQKGRKFTEEQTAWDNLTKIETLLVFYSKEKINFLRVQKQHQKAALLKDKYEDAKDSVLNTLYNQIKEDFVSYYRFIHQIDEGKFDADFRAKGSELDMKVDFYGRGKHPPLALHSEGHQDSMGICLYLALMKLLSGDKVNLTILDDVLMSIDSGHRRAVSKLLIEFFGERQFLLTTHNRTWARQLRTDNVVRTKNNMIEFANWSVESGPTIDEDKIVWDKIEKFLKKNNVSSASHALREDSEFYFSQVCEKIHATTLHKCDERYELGELLPPAISRYRELLKKAKKSADSWNKKEDVEKIAKLESIFKEIVERSQVEQWGINENVHYSKWGDFQPEDFQPIVEAFKDIYDLFRCSQCGSLLYLTQEKKSPRNLRCMCEEVNWNLVPKKQN